MSSTGRWQETQAGKAGQEDSSFAPWHKWSRCGLWSISLSEGAPRVDLPRPHLTGAVILSFPSKPLSHQIGALTPVPPAPPAEFLFDVALWASSGFCELQRCSPATPKHQSASSSPQGRGRMVPSVLRITLLQGTKPGILTEMI